MHPMLLSPFVMQVIDVTDAWVHSVGFECSGSLKNQARGMV
jgi:hypothetical protein